MGILEQIQDAKSLLKAQPHPCGADFATRLVAPEAIIDGFEDGFLTDGELVLTVKRLKAKIACLETESGMGRCVFIYHLDGQRTIDIPGVGSFDLRLPTLAGYYQPKGLSKTNFWAEGNSDISVGLGFNPESPPPVIDVGLAQIQSLSDFLCGSSDEFRWFELPLTPELETAARSIVTPSIHPSLLKSYLGAKADELLCLTLDRINSVKATRQQYEDTIECKLEAAKQLIETELCEKICADELSCRVGLSKNELLKSFEDTYGITLFTYSAMVRMSHSLHLLTTTNLPLKRIAFDVGYNHASNFCFAFKRQYGVTPKEFRKARVLN